MGMVNTKKQKKRVSKISKEESLQHPVAGTRKIIIYAVKVMSTNNYYILAAQEDATENNVVKRKQQIHSSVFGKTEEVSFNISEELLSMKFVWK